MPVGLLAKLVAFFLFALAAVGVFVGGRHVAALFDKLAGPRTPAVAHSSTPPPGSRPDRHNAIRPAAPTPKPPPVTPSPSIAAPRPRRGALRPRHDSPAATTPTVRATRATPGSAPTGGPVMPRADSAAPVITEQRPPPPPMVPPPVVNAERTGPEPVLLDLAIGRLAERTVAAFRDRDVALIPLGAFFSLAEIEYSITTGGVLTARLQPSGESVRVAADSDTVAVGDRRLPVGTGDLLFQDGELFMATDQLGAMLDVHFEVNWPDLAVTVLDPDSLPVARRIRRDELRALLAERYGARPDTILGPPRTKWDGLVLDYDVSLPLSDNLVGGSSYQFALGAQVAGGALEIGVRSLGVLDAGTAELAASWKGVWIDNKWVKQLTLGTGTLTGPRYAGIRGVAVTNSPYIRPSYVGQLDYYGRLDPGWQLEAYSGSQLVAFDSIGASGDYSLSLPVGYGENPVDFVAYGPYGQVRRFNQTYRVVSEQLPYKQFEYGVALGECVSTLCNDALNADLHYGLSRRVTVRGGVEGYSRDSLSNLVHPYAVATGLVGNSLTLEGEAVGNGWLRGAVRLEPSLDFRLAAGYTTFDTSVESPVIAPVGRRGQWLFDAFVRPVSRISTFYFQGVAEIDQGVEVDVTRARLQGSVQASAVRLYPYVRFERFSPALGAATSNSFAGLSAYATGRPSWGSVLGALWFRGDLETGGGQGMNLAAATVARSFGPALRVEAGAGWHRGSPGTTFTFSLVSYLPTLQATTTAVAPTEGPGGVVQTVQGALIYDAAQGRVTANPNPGIQRAGVSGTVFQDDNANGRHDPGEPGAGGVRVLVGSFSTRTDSLGRYHVWDVPAFEPVQVQIDTTSLDNPLYVPAFTSASLQPPPNAYRELDLPLVTGTVLDGRVVCDGTALRGVTLVLTNRSTGRQTAVTTFSDGSFYVLGIKPGHYTLEVDPRDLAARRLFGSLLQITAPPDHPGQLSNLVIEAHSAP